MNIQHTLVKSLAPVTVAIAACLLVGGLSLGLLANKTAHAENQRIVTIYHDNQEQIVATSANTVGDVLTRAGIPVGEQDSVEPIKNTKLVAQNYTINLYRARPIIVVDGEQRYRIMSPYQSARKIAEAAGLVTYDEDSFTLERIDDFLVENGIGLKLTITRSTPLNMMLYGQNVALRTQAKTVKELLQEKKITLGHDDGVSPAIDTPISSNMTIDVYRNGVQTVNEEQPVNFSVKRIQDGDQEIGYKEVKEAGTPGKRVVTFEIELKNGKEISRKEIQNVVTVQPKEQLEIVGIKRPGFNGSVDEAFAKLRACEAGGNYDRNSGNGYYGAYQFNIGTWAGYGGYTIPSEAPPGVQDQKAYETYQRRGWSPWPACSQRLGLW
jgi:uncharacterized protein YabE (DUF348 family)